MYGVEDIPKMTQISAAELIKVVGNVSVPEFNSFSAVTFVIGLVIGGVITYFILKGAKGVVSGKKKGKQK